MPSGIFILFLTLGFIMDTTMSMMDWKRSSSLSKHPCMFNALCTCSSPGPNLGLVQCINTPLASVPLLNASTVFILHLENNQLHFLDEAKLLNTEMRILRIRHNPITSLSENNFASFQHSLRELDLQHNQLHFFPKQATQHLERLKSLDLTGNVILSVQKDDFHGLEQCLQTLSLRSNSLTNIPQDTFSELYKLESLDLSENRLTTLSQTSFNSGLAQLQHFYLSGNALKVIPYGAMARMKSLRTVDLSHNSIITTNLIDDDTTTTILLKMIGELKLEKLILDSNNIQELQSKSFRHFATLRVLSLDGNPLRTIYDNAFAETSIAELHLRGCELTNLNLMAFNGLSSMLSLIDISYTLLNGSAIGATLINMTSLVNVSLVGNPESAFSLELLVNSSRSLQHLHVESSSRESNKYGFTIDTNQIGYFRQLQTLGMSRFNNPLLYKEIFTNFSQTIEEIVLSGSNLKSLDADYFENLPRLNGLDISSSSLLKLDKNTFKSIGRSLKTLNMANAFHYTVIKLPTNVFRHLETLKQLDISNNRFKFLSNDTFWNLHSLEYLNLQDNYLSNLDNGTFLGTIHSNLICIKLSYNCIDQLDSNTFSNLDSLKYLYLDGNTITIIRKEAFHNLDKLKYVNIEFNSIVSIEKDSFQNLPCLERLNLANNHLEKFTLNIFDQIGTLSTTMEVDVSRNRIQRLAAANATGTTVPIKSLDLSYNNISNSNRNYFHPVKNFLVKLFLSHNKLCNITKTTFGQMPRLQLLHLDNNQISTVDSDAFENIPSLRVIQMSHNHLTNIPSQLFLQHFNLQHLDMSNNELRELPNSFFHGAYHLEYLTLARNHISEVIHTTFLPILSNLKHLDMSHNDIQDFSYEVQHMLTNLYNLDLSNNKLIKIPIDNFNRMKRMHILNLSNNHIGNLSLPQESTVEQLECLDLSNTRLENIPELNFPNLFKLNLSYNAINFLEVISFVHMKFLRQLDLSHNKMNSIPAHLWPTLSTHLTNLYLAYNPIIYIKNESFLSLNVLDELQLQAVSTKTIQSGIMFPLKYVRSLHINHYSQTLKTDTTVPFDMVHSMSFMDNLRSLHLYFNDMWNGSYLDSQFAFRSRTQSTLPHTLISITISGETFTKFDKSLLNSLQSRQLKLTIRNTSLTSLSLVGSLGKVRKLKLDVSQNKLVSLKDLNILQNTAGISVLVEDLNLKYNNWKCDCEISWVLTWLRRLKQNQCWYGNDPSVNQVRSEELVRRLQETECFNYRNKSLINVLKFDLKCDHTSSAKLNQNSNFNVVVMLIFTVLFFF